MKNSQHVNVIPLTGVSQKFTYKCPEFVKINRGSLVLIPFANRRILGIVDSFTIPIVNAKELIKAIYDFPVLTNDLIYLGKWISSYYGCSYKIAFECILPSFVRKGKYPKKEFCLKLKEAFSSELCEKLQKRAPKQAQLYKLLSENNAPYKVLLKQHNISNSIAEALLAKNILEKLELKTNLHIESSDPHILTNEQALAVDDIKNSLKSEEHRSHLLHGITGSGKTEVYLSAIEEALTDDSATALYLVPEIALTEQSLERIQKRLFQKSIRASLWHSQLTDSERAKIWFDILEGKTRVVIGARSALFTPLQNLKILIVDEEHEGSYKQSESPRYHARDLAVYRSYLNKGVCILGSATPSLESYSNAKKQKYRLNVLSKRVEDRNLPAVKVVDMSHEKAWFGGGLSLSQDLREKLADRLNKKEQSILFINRRGYSPSMKCKDCGSSVQCKYCSLTLVYHKSKNTLICHMCGHSQSVPKFCPACKKDNLKIVGSGTQRVEETVQKLLPQSRIARIDTDTSRNHAQMSKVMQDFKAGNLDILIGTQMIAKGLDFPNVTLVGLINADIGLNMSDFRAEERTFQLIIQVAGRSGRGKTKGEVVIQTFRPDSSCIKNAINNDFESFVNRELDSRNTHGFPPTVRLIRQVLSSTSLAQLEFVSKEWLIFLKKQCGSLKVIGPAPAPNEKIKNFYRFQVLFFTKNTRQTLSTLDELKNKFKFPKNIQSYFDVDPVDLT